MTLKKVNTKVAPTSLEFVDLDKLTTRQRYSLIEYVAIKFSESPTEIGQSTFVFYSSYEQWFKYGGHKK